MPKLKSLYFTAIFVIILFACNRHKPGDKPATLRQLPQAVAVKVPIVAPPVMEDFEQGRKNSYAAGQITLASGSWTFDDGMTGSSAADHKSGGQAVRLRKAGKLHMNFDVMNGASTVTIEHALYGTDGKAGWQLWVSANAGSTYAQVDSTISSGSTTVQTVTFKVNRPGRIRFELRKVSGNGRINIDDFTIYSYGDTTRSAGDSTSVNASDNTNLLLGNPSNATNSIASKDNYLMDQGYFVESYNAKQGKPNWVSWYLGSSTVGKAKRQDDFRANAALPKSFYIVQDSSYSGSGFDRGHNCPSADRTTTTAANSSTFLMTNMMPQAPNNNKHTWANLENYERMLVNHGNELYVICGSYGMGGTGSKGFATTIDKGHITVPSNTWKIIVVLPNGYNDLERIGLDTRIIAVNMPNINNINPDWKNYVTTVNAIELATGYDLLSNLPAGIQLVLEARADGGI